MQQQHRKPTWRVETEQTRAYGMFRSLIFLPDGSRFEGWGLTEQQAEYRARVRAQEGAPR